MAAVADALLWLLAVAGQISRFEALERTHGQQQGAPHATQLGALAHDETIVTRRVTSWLLARLICANLPALSELSEALCGV